MFLGSIWESTTSLCMGYNGKEIIFQLGYLPLPGAHV